jgi:hypothetical protein
MVVLVAFAIGLVVGVLGMVPRWWRERQSVKKAPTISAGITSPTEVSRGV